MGGRDESQNVPQNSDACRKLDSVGVSARGDRCNFEKTEELSRSSTSTSTVTCSTAAGGGKRYGTFSTAWPILAVHALSAAITVGLIVIYMTGVAWDPNTAQINALLVASKVYEWLILGSLGDIVLHLVRAALARPGGIALGLLASPFQLTSGGYFFSRQLWKGAAKPTRLSGSDATLTIQILGLLILAMTIGPSTGILMLPKLGWWGFPKTDILGLAQVQELVGAFLVEGNYESFYPSQDVIDQALGVVLKLDDLNESLFNYSFSQSSHPKSISLGWQFERSPRSEAVVYATAPLDLVSDVLHTEATNAWRRQTHSLVNVYSNAVNLKNARWTAASPFLDVSYNDAQWRQPIIAVHCTEVDRRDGADTAIFDPTGPFAVLPPVSLHGLATGGSNESLRFIDPPAGTPGSVSAVAVWRGSNETTLCYIGSKWAESAVWITKPADLVAQSDLSVDPAIALGYRFDDMSNPVTISPEWANNGLNAGLSPGESANNFTRGRSPCTDANMPRCIAVSLSLYLTDALSRLFSPDMYSCKWAASQPGAIEAPRFLDCERRGSSDHNPEITVPYSTLTQYTGMAFSYHRYRYAYGFGGIAEGLAFLALLCHLLAVLLHLLEHYVRNNTYAQRGWSDIGELVVGVLRKNSPGLVPTDAEEYCGKDTWKLRVLVRRDSPVQPAEIRIERRDDFGD
ncbi:hypothetical protein GQ53DRAFT_807132 [Thozetella sp. PMI_491]|nr:hypothetical protein GQ53DRAFT_807132 [Thozetella sp. PMI_491]